MVKKAVLLTVFAAGYVLGAKAGRQRYEQIRSAFLKVKNDPHVREKAHEVAEFAHEHGSALTDKVAEKVSDKLGDDVDGDLRPHGATVKDPYAVGL